MQDNKLKSRTHLENFSLKDFIGKTSENLAQRLKGFSEVVDHLTEEGLLVYQRTLLSPTEREVLVEDPLTGGQKQMLMFGSNNYLSLSTHPHVVKAAKEAIDQYGIGSGGPPLFNGTTQIHKNLVEKIAKMKDVESALLFSSGYAAQIGWLTSLVDKDDVVIFDEYSHASTIDAIKMVKVKGVPCRHNDVENMEKRLRHYRERGRNCWICVEGVYSMDGDLAPLEQIVALAKKYDCYIALDDAHGTGVTGDGRGTCHHFNINPDDITVHFGTLSKVLSCSGGFIAGGKKLIDYLRYIARPHMFSAALPAPVAATALAGLEVIENDKNLVAKLHENVQYLTGRFQDMGIHTSSCSGIVPVMLPAGSDIRRMSKEFHQRGIFINSVEYPAVDISEQRFRISMMATHTREDIDTLADAFQAVFKKNKIIS